jgi:hypothetical protein
MAHHGPLAGVSRFETRPIAQKSTPACIKRFSEVGEFLLRRREVDLPGQLYFAMLQNKYKNYKTLLIFM